MTKWKLTRQMFGTEEFTFQEGDEATIGRAIDNTLPLHSIVISRKHCVIRFLADKAVITDTGSANGVYVGQTKIPRNSPYDVKNSEIIGLGWTMGLVDTKNVTPIKEKYMFKLTKEHDTSVIDTQLDEIEEKIAALDTVLPILNDNFLKRKSNHIACDDKKRFKQEIKKEKRCRIITMDDDIISLSDSDSDIQTIDDDYVIEKDQGDVIKNPNVKPINDKNHEKLLCDVVKSEDNDMELEAYNIKQEYLGYDEPIQIESDSDSESENWFIRLSQNSPGKPFSQISKIKTEKNVANSSYSQMDDDYPIDNVQKPDNRQSYTDIDEEFVEDIIKLPMPLEKSPAPATIEKPGSDIEEFADDIITLCDTQPDKNQVQQISSSGQDETDGLKNLASNQIDLESTIKADVKKTQMIEPLIHSPKGKSKRTSSRSKYSHSSSKQSKSKYSSRHHISNSQKEERKKKLKEIATKEKDSDKQSKNMCTSSTSKPTTNVKITNTNRGAFLTNSEVAAKPVNIKDKNKKEKSHSKSIEIFKCKTKKHEEGLKSPEDRENKTNHSSKSESLKKEHKSSKSKEQSQRHNSKSKSDKDKHDKSSNVESREPLKSLKPKESGKSVNENDKSSKVLLQSEVAPQLPPKKPKKSVRFSDASNTILEFEIEPGNEMKKIVTKKNSHVDIKITPVYSLEKIVLLRILKWNPQWIKEQTIFGGLPPILGENVTPATIFHAFTNHRQYIQQVGDLLIMEIWESLTQGYNVKNKDQTVFLEMRIESLPPKPRCANERPYDSLYSFSLNISLQSHELKKLPRQGDILIIEIGVNKSPRFFYVYYVRCLPSPPNNIHTFYSIGLQAAYSEKLDTLRMGEVLVCQSVVCISKEINIFSAMEYLGSNPLSEAILCPQPSHFETNPLPPNIISTKWTQTLNPSQLTAVSNSVAAALSDKPCIQIVQGPPGTGKSSVICSIVMSYFYNGEQHRRQGRGKILICATSNAAVDGLVCRLLEIRQSLPKEERFRMVRVGRVEAMSERARYVSSQTLVSRDIAARQNAVPPAERESLREEISHLEARINMWKCATLEAKNPARIAFCQTRINEIMKKLDLLRAGGGRKGLRNDQMMEAEKRVIEGADIIVTTLSSACNHKMLGIRGRVALCIVDEAGQAIEPETLLPLTLDVTHLTLIGDPQQLPGYISSQFAKKYGLGESLFARLVSNSERWATNPVILLDEQYRMHPDIADYPNRAFYGGLVRSVSLPRPDIQLLPYVLLGISSGDRGQGASGGNEMEACGVARLVCALAAALRPLALSLGVITPYNAHRELLKKNLRMLQPPSEAVIEVNTVDSFQGQERDVVVVSLARSQGVGFLTEPGRMNVMLTRARHALVVALNPHAVQKNYQWRTLLDDARQRKLYRALPNQMCQPITTDQVKQDTILKYISSK